MRRLFIAFGVAAFLAYCWASVVYQNRVTVPDYRTVTVDILGKGKTREQWDADTQGQFQRLMDLESAKYQLPAGADLAVPAAENESDATGAKGAIPSGRPLTSDDFKAIIAAVPPGQGLVMELRDTSDIHRLVNKGYLLRDPVILPGADPEQPPLYNYARPIDKETIDGLLAHGVRVVTVTGHGAPVNFELGTAIMIAIIFLTLAAALKPLLWDPFRVMLDRRRQELEAGAEAERQNRESEAKLEEAKKEQNARLLRDLEDLHKRLQSDAERKAADIVRETREKEKQVKLAGLRRLGNEAGSVRKELERDVPELARLIADTLTPKAPGSESKWPKGDG